MNVYSTNCLMNAALGNMLSCLPQCNAAVLYSQFADLYLGVTRAVMGHDEKKRDHNGDVRNCCHITFPRDQYFGIL